jgi:hypothetical protein
MHLPPQVLKPVHHVRQGGGLLELKPRNLIPASTGMIKNSIPQDLGNLFLRLALMPKNPSIASNPYDLNDYTSDERSYFLEMR